MIETARNGDSVAIQSTIYRTKDYSKFKIMPGNRPVREDRVRGLAHRMKKYGNLMQFSPVQITPEWEIIDGQTRVGAAELNKFEVFYEIKEGANVEVVRQLNGGMNNWDWRDFAESYAAKGNLNYKRFLETYDGLHLPFRVVLGYFLHGKDKGVHTTARGKSGSMATFMDGDFKVTSYDLVRERLLQLREAVDIIGNTNRAFATAMFRIMTKPGYDHQEMLAKLIATPEATAHCINVDEFYFVLEQMQLAK